MLLQIQSQVPRSSRPRHGHRMAPSLACQKLAPAPNEHSDSLSRDFLATETIATSSGQNDGGVFKLSFRDGRLRAPFEYAGAAGSRWTVELPPRSNSFDFPSLKDVILHIDYTAKEGGPALREVAERAAWMRLPGDGVRFLDVRSEFPTTCHGAFKSLDYDEKNSVGESIGGKETRHSGKRTKHCRRIPVQLSTRPFPS